VLLALQFVDLLRDILICGQKLTKGDESADDEDIHLYGPFARRSVDRNFFAQLAIACVNMTALPAARPSANPIRAGDDRSSARN
jgi:hypothetical protein